ncbi:MAG: AsmA family protein [Paludibacteraceae bacterium]|nr:AsmA family protein [Paludibacteraceae bacterium]
MKAVKIISGILASIVGLALVAVITVYNVIPTKYGASKISEYVSDMLKGELKIGDLDYSFFSTFPNVTVTLDSVNFISEALDKPDSLASFSKLYASVDLIEFLKNDKVCVDSFYLSDPTIFLRIDTAGNGNWNVYESKAEKDTTQTKIPEIFIAALNIKNAKFTFLDEQNQRKASTDSLDLNLKGEYASQIKAKMHLETPALAYCDTTVDVAPVPFAVNADVVLDSLVRDFDIKDFAVFLDDAMFALNGKLKTDAEYKSFDTDLAFDVNIPDVEHLRSRVPQPYDKHVDMIISGGAIHSYGVINGLYKADTLPTINGNVDLNDVWISFKGNEGRLSANMRSHMSLNFMDKGKSFVQIDTLDITQGSSYLKTQAKVDRVLTDNPHIDAKVALSLMLDKLSQVLPKIRDLVYSGDIKADADARFDLQDLQKFELHKIYAHANVGVSRIRAKMPSESVNFFSKNLNIESGVNSMRSKRSNKLLYFTTRLDVDTMMVKYGRFVNMTTKSFNASYTADSVLNHIPFVRGSIRFGGMKTFVNDTMAIVGNKATVSLTMRQDTIDKFVPRLTARISMDSMMCFVPAAALLTDSLRMSLSIYPRARKFKRVNGEMVAVSDKERKYVGIDSLGRILNKVSVAEDPVDQALKSFRFDGKSNIKLARYYTPYMPLRTTMRNMDLSFTDDTINLNSMRVRIGKSMANMSGEMRNLRRYLLRGRTLSADLYLTSKRINFNELLNASYKGAEVQKTFEKLKEAERMGLIKPMVMTGDMLVRPQVFERGYLQKVEEMRSKRNSDPARRAKLDSLMAKVDAQHKEDSIMLAKSAESEKKGSDSDADAETSAEFGLLCLPSNLDIKFKTKVDTARFANLILRNFNGGVLLKNSTLMLKDLSTKTNIGDLKLNAMYHCNDKNGADAGIDVQGSNVDITNLVNTMPEIDSLVPMLRSFQGVVTVDLTAKTSLDSTYNLLLPSLSAATVIRGDSLVLMDGETFSEVAKLLMFKKKTKNLIDNISVELLLDNNEMQVLPFMVEMDKYKVAVGGQNSLDMNFDYHISVLKSPLPTKLGVNVTGTLDKMKIRLAKCKYKDEKTVTRKGQFSNGGVNLRSELQNNLRAAIRNAVNTYATEQKNQSAVVNEEEKKKKQE